MVRSDRVSVEPATAWPQKPQHFAVVWGLESDWAFQESGRYYYWKRYEACCCGEADAGSSLWLTDAFHRVLGIEQVREPVLRVPTGQALRHEGEVTPYSLVSLLCLALVLF